MKFFIVAVSKGFQTFSFSVNAKSESHAGSKAFKHLTKTLDVMPKQIKISSILDNHYCNGYSYPEIKIK